MRLNMCSSLGGYATRQNILKEHRPLIKSTNIELKTYVVEPYSKVKIDRLLWEVVDGLTKTIWSYYFSSSAWTF